MLGLPFRSEIIATQKRNGQSNRSFTSVISLARSNVALYHRDRDDSVSGVGEPDMSKDPSGLNQWVGTEARFAPKSRLD